MKLFVWLATYVFVSLAAAQGTCEPGFRFFEHDILVGDPICVPEEPERVVSILNASIIYPYDIKPLTGYSLDRDAANFPPIASWLESGIEEISEDEPNLELLLELEPDLMFFAQQKVEAFVSQLKPIAPTVMYDENTDWRDLSLFIGDVLGRSEEAAAELATLDQRITELTEAVKTDLGDVSNQTAAFIRIRDDGEYRLASNWFASYVCTEILAEIGYRMPPAVQDIEGEFLELGQETIPEANSDVLFLVGSEGGNVDQSASGTALVASVLEDPIWQAVDAVKNQQVYEVSDYWLSTTSLLAAHFIVDDMTETFGVEVATPNPFAEVAEASMQ